MAKKKVAVKKRQTQEQSTETQTEKTTMPENTTQFEIVADAPIPAAARAGRKVETVYPFDSMQVGNSFFVPNSEKMPDAAKSLASTVSSATARYNVPAENGETETVTVRTYAKDPATGKLAKGPDGKRVVERSETVTRPKMVHTRKFVVRAVTDGANWKQPGVAGAVVARTI